MQTNFNAVQLADPSIARADELLRRCVHCGLCTGTCPTYVLTGDERDGPRGRIYLMKQMFEQREVTPTMTYHLDRCLSCYACMTTCPSDVDYMHLLDLARVQIEKKGRRAPSQRLWRWFLSTVLPYPQRFRLALIAGRMAKPLTGLLAKLRFNRVVAALNLVPPDAFKLKVTGAKSEIARGGSKRKRVALLLGCVQRVLAPGYTVAAIRLLKRHGVDVVVVKDEACCGALVHQLGRDESARDQARRNIDAWTAAMRDQQLDAIVVTTSGCGTMIKDYGTLLARDHGYAERATFVSGLARDITELLDEVGLVPPVMWTGFRVAYHAPCSLQHAQRLDQLPLTLLDQAGYSVVEIPEGHLCCGSAGTYNLLEPKLAGELRARKLRNIENVTPDVIATGNIGCVTQLESGTSVPFVHTIELLDWATGGPCPPSLAALKDRAHPVEALVEMAREGLLSD
ncbi:MAG: glycolate oxidase subunit GlcF [Methyloceanibacter sp.]